MGVCISNASGQSVVVTNERTKNCELQHAAHVEVSEVKNVPMREQICAQERAMTNACQDSTCQDEEKRKNITNRNAAKRLAFTAQRSRSELSLPQLDARRETIASISVSSIHSTHAYKGAGSSHLEPKQMSPMSVVSRSSATKSCLPSRLNSLTQTSHCGVSVSVNAEGSGGLGIGQGKGEVQRVRHSSFNSTLCGSAPHLNSICAGGSNGGALLTSAVHSSSNQRGNSLPSLPSPPHDAKAKTRGGSSCFGVKGDSNSINTYGGTYISTPRGPSCKDVAGQGRAAIGGHHYSAENTAPTLSSARHDRLAGTWTAGGSHSINNINRGEHENQREDVRIVEINLSSVGMSSQCDEEQRSSSLSSSSSSLVSFSGDSELYYATRLISVTYDVPTSIGTSKGEVSGAAVREIVVNPPPHHDNPFYSSDLNFSPARGPDKISNSATAARSESVDRDTTHVSAPRSLVDRRGGGSFRSARFHSTETPSCAKTIHGSLFSPSTVFTPRPTSEGIHNAFKPLRFPEVVRAHRMAVKKAHEAVRTLASIRQGLLASDAPPCQVLLPQVVSPSLSRAAKLLQALDTCAADSPLIQQEGGSTKTTSSLYYEKAEARGIITKTGPENAVTFNPHSPLFIETASRSSTEGSDAAVEATLNHNNRLTSSNAERECALTENAIEEIGKKATASNSIGIAKIIGRRLLDDDDLFQQGARSPLPYVPAVLISSAETTEALLEELSLRGNAQTTRAHILRDGGAVKDAGENDDPAESISAQLSPTSCGSPTFLLPSVRAVSSCDFFSPAPPNLSQDNGSSKREGMLLRAPSNISSCGSSAYLQAGSSTTLCNSSYGRRHLAYGAPSEGKGGCSVAQRRRSGEQLSFLSQIGDDVSHHTSSAGRRSSRESIMGSAKSMEGRQVESCEGHRPTWANTDGVVMLHTPSGGDDRSHDSAPTLQRRTSVVTLLL